MNLPPSTQRKVDSLKRMTVANGATASEAESATRMIAQIYERYHLTYTQPSDTINHIPKKNSNTKFDMSKFYSAVSNGTLENNVTEFDWDEIAKSVLNVYDFMDYVTQTGVAWEQWMNGRYGMKPPNGIPLTENEYRRKCYRTFMKIKGN